MDLTWFDSVVGKFDQNFSTIIAKLALVKSLRCFYLRIFMEVDTRAPIDIVWQGLVSILIQQKISMVLREVPFDLFQTYALVRTLRDCIGGERRRH